MKNAASDDVAFELEAESWEKAVRFGRLFFRT